MWKASWSEKDEESFELLVVNNKHQKGKSLSSQKCVASFGTDD